MSAQNIRFAQTTLFVAQEDDHSGLPNRMRTGGLHIMCLFWAVVAGFTFAAPVSGFEQLNFPREVSIDFHNVTKSILCLDVDGDGDQDIAAGTDAGGIVFIALNSSSRFMTLDYHPVGGRVVDMALLPRDAPEKPLLLVATANPDQLVLLSYQNSYPSIEHEATVALQEDPGKISVGHVGADGSAGAVVSQPGWDSVVVVCEINDQWQQTQSLPTGDQPLDAVLLDLNGDDVPEILTANAGSLSQSLMIFSQNAEGFYEMDSQFPCPGQPQSLCVYDQDGDQVDELFVSYGDEALVSIYTPDGGTLAVVEQVVTSMPIDGVVVAPLSTGGVAMLCWNRVYEVVHYYSHDMDTWELSSSLYTGSEAADIDACDLDGDTCLDLIVANGDAERIAVVLGNDLPGFWGYLVTFLPDTPVVGETVDINADGNPDAVVACHWPATIEILHGDGAGNLVQAKSLAFDDYLTDIVVTHIDGDNLLDIAVLMATQETVIVLLGEPDGEFTQLEPMNVTDIPFRIEAADVDGDGFTDLSIAAAGDNTISVFFGAGDGTFPAAVSIDAGAPINAFFPVDLDSNGLLDIVVSGGLSTVRVALNSGGRVFNPLHSYVVGDGVRIGAVADMDGDVDLDLILVNESTTSLFLMRNSGLGTLFQLGEEFRVSDIPDFIDAADIDVDGTMDLLLTYTDGGVVRVHTNQGDWQLSYPYVFPTTPEPIQAQVGDFNSDDIPDFLVLDAQLEIALVMLNVEPNPVPVNPAGLEVACRSNAVELVVRPDDFSSWKLEGWAVDRWHTLAADGVAVVGKLTNVGQQWQLVLSVDEVHDMRLSPGSEGRFLFRVCCGPAHSDPLVVSAPVGCLVTTPDLMPRPLTVSHPIPNPFNPRVAVGFAIANGTRVTAEVFDMAGHRVAVLTDQWYPAGNHVLHWDGRTGQGPAGAGAYMLTLATADQIVSRKITLLK